MASSRAAREFFKGEFSVFLSYVPQPNLKMDNLGDYIEVLQPVVALELDRENTVADTALRALLQSIQKASGHEYLTTTSAGVASSNACVQTPFGQARPPTQIGLPP